MKKISPFLFLLIFLETKAQQNFSNNFLSKTHDFTTLAQIKKSYSQKNLIVDYKTRKNQIKDSLRIDALGIDLPWFGIEGAGNLNEETFKTTNGSLKATLYARPLQYRNKALTIYASYNVNASNNDSILFSTLLFPEVGKNSFLGTAEWTTYWTKSDSNRNIKRGHALGPFLEFSHKNIKTDSSEDGQKLYFSTLNYTAGLKYSFNFFKIRADSSSNDTEASLSFVSYLSYLNIPDEDITDYQAILARGNNITPATIKENIFSWGLKVMFQVNSFGIFADFRSVIGGEKKFPIRELKGFHANIGFTLNSEFLHLK